MLTDSKIDILNQKVTFENNLSPLMEEVGKGVNEDFERYMKKEEKQEKNIDLVIEKKIITQAVSKMKSSIS